MLDGITWLDLALSGVWTAVAGIPVPVLLAMMPKSKARLRLIWAWALMPFALWLVTLLTLPIGAAMFFGVILAIVLPGWAGISALTYYLVLRLRDFAGGEQYGDGN